MNTTPDASDFSAGADHSPETIDSNIERLTRRIAVRSRILTGNHGHNPNPARVAQFEAEQHAILDQFAAELAYWHAARDALATTSTTKAEEPYEYVVPIDPMDDLQCDSCQ